MGLPAYVGPEASANYAPKPMTEKELTKLSKRIAAIHDRRTQWELDGREGIPLEIIGDSQIITSWLNGTSRAHDKHYQKRIDKFVDKCEYLSQQFNIVPPSAGSNLIRHEYREANDRADRLTHLARQGQNYIIEQFDLSPYKRAVKYPACYRAMFDGGVSAEGVGCGFWIQAGLLPIRDECVAKADRRLEFVDVCEASFCIDPSSSVTDAELSAVENCMDAVEKVITYRQHTFFC